MDETKKVDIIIFALSRFDGPYSSTPISLAKEFSKEYRVFYLNHPYSFKDLISLKRKRNTERPLPPLVSKQNIYTPFYSKEEDSGVVMVTIPATLPVNFLSEGTLYRMGMKLNNQIFFSALRRLIKDKKIRDFIFLNAYDPYFGADFPDDIKPVAKIYYSLDDIEEDIYTRKHGVRLEREIMAKYDFCLTTSRELMNNRARYAKKIYYLPNAADISLFKTAYTSKFPRPDEFSGLTGKIIGYIGNIEKRLDYELVKEIALKNKDKHVMLVGPTSTDEFAVFGLDKIDNIIFTGGKKISELPAYLQNMDCAIIPFRCNKLTRSIYPLKINEYLAAGKPVVSTDFSDAIREFREVAYIAENREAFVGMIDRAIEEDDQEKIDQRIRFAGGNSWTDRANRFWKIHNDFIAEQKLRIE